MNGLEGSERDGEAEEGSVPSCVLYLCFQVRLLLLLSFTFDLLLSAACGVDDVAAVNYNESFQSMKVMFTEAETLSLVGLNVRGGAMHVGLDKINNIILIRIFF